MYTTGENYYREEKHLKKKIKCASKFNILYQSLQLKEWKSDEVKLALARKCPKVTLQLDGYKLLGKYLLLMLTFGRAKSDTLWTTKRRLPSVHLAHISKGVPPRVVTWSSGSDLWYPNITH